MDVHGIGGAYGHLPAVVEATPAESAPEQNDEVEAEPEPAASVADPDGEGTKGVVRLLLAGHFKGVADVRLRINLYDELVAAESAALQPVALQNTSALSETVDAQIEELVSSGELSDQQVADVAELRDEYHTVVSALLEQFSNSGRADVQALLVGVQSAFDSLTEALRSVLLPADGADVGPVAEADLTADGAPDAQATEVPTASDPGSPAEQQVEVEAFLKALADGFAVALEEVKDSLAAASVLPELTPPNGNGVAYWKFLAIYNEMRGVSEGPDASPDEPVDLVA